MEGWIPVVIYSAAIFLIFYFLLILPRKRQDKKHRQMLDSLERGDEVVTIGGIHGKVHQLQGEVLLIEVAKDVVMTFSKLGIAYKVDPGLEKQGTPDR